MFHAGNTWDWGELDEVAFRPGGYEDTRHRLGRVVDAEAGALDGDPCRSRPCRGADRRRRRLRHPRRPQAGSTEVGPALRPAVAVPVDGRTTPAVAALSGNGPALSVAGCRAGAGDQAARDHAKGGGRELKIPMYAMKIYSTRKQAS